MHIMVRLAEPYWRCVGRRELSLEVEESACVGDLVALFRQHYPALSQEMDEAAPLIIVGEAECSSDTALTAGCCVHLVWPLAGG